MLVLPVFAAFATSLMVDRVDLLIADFLAVGAYTLARKCPVALRLPGLGFVQPDALTPALSHGERVQTLKTATRLPFCFYLLDRAKRDLHAAVLRFAFRRAVAGDRI